MKMVEKYGREINDEIQSQINEYIEKMESITGKKFGDKENPLLVSVRSGARASMPGMMDTILNLGLNETVVNTIAEKSNNPRWAWDCYRRFIQMYSDVVMEVGKKYFEQLIDEMKEKKGVTQDIELDADDLKELATQFKKEYKDKIGTDFPDDPKEQLMGAIKAVFRSWDNPRANVYRRDNDIPYSWGTAVNVQSMAFGNMGDDCGTGVAFTRDPATGEKGLFGEFLTNAQGEDVVAGVRTPMHITEMEEKFPEAFEQFKQVCKTLEDHYRDMQDMEFTVEHGKLYMLQTRNGKRTAQAALKIACDLVDEGMRSEEEAVAMIDPRNLDTLLHPQFDAKKLKEATPIGKGLGASPGAACGKVVFTADDAVAWNEKGEKVVLVRLETSPEDITGMKASQGILTVRGGMTSHAAVVARGMGTCCVSGCGDIVMDEENKKFTLAGITFHEGDEISIDGSTGNIYNGIIPTVDATIAGEFGRVMEWADKIRTLKVRTNADTPADAKKARELGAEGIGLCRTEHMFFEEDRIAAFREMICSDTVEEREAAPLGKGLGASPGAAAGKVVFTAEDAEAWAAKGKKVVLVRLETSPEDITGMKASQGILTVRGGMTSHAAVVARGMGTCCVSGCGDIVMDEENKQFTLAGKTFHEGDEISIDGSTGNIYDGLISTVDASIAGEFGRVMEWADKIRTLKVRTNADTPADAKKARELGAEGIGLCRTEHMFFEEDRIAAFREMICSDTVEEREAALDKILPYQQGDFEELYEALEGYSVTIRFLDPPLHEFVPTEEADIKKLADAKGKTVEEIKNYINSLHEFNPMMGHRGCRLAVTYPEIAKMQTKAVIRAAINVSKKHPDWNIVPEIMIPLVCELKELKYVKNIVVETADAEIKAAGSDLKYQVGTMIEIPRAALTADEIATEADFFCFGTNDLTQMTFGFSRDDAGKFLDAYYDAKIFENDPFARLDQNGVGKLMETAIKLGKPVNKNLHIGICGEHGGDPTSVEFCHNIGLDYVSCSPFRVPIARLAAAQAAIKAKKN